MPGLMNRPPPKVEAGTICGSDSDCELVSTRIPHYPIEESCRCAGLEASAQEPGETNETSDDLAHVICGPYSLWLMRLGWNRPGGIRVQSAGRTEHAVDGRLHRAQGEVLSRRRARRYQHGQSRNPRVPAIR